MLADEAIHSERPRARRRRLIRALIIVLLAAGPAAGVVTYQVAARYENDRVTSLFAEYMSELGADLELELSAVAEELHRMAALFSLRPGISVDEFRALARSVRTVHPLIHACEWVARVPPADRDRFEKDMRSRGLAGFSIVSAPPPAGVTSAYPRSFYPLSYIEPEDGDELPRGLDLRSDSGVWKGLSQATRTETLVLTDPIDVQHPHGSTREILAVVPVYGAGLATRPPATPAQAAWRELHGFVIFVLRGGGIFHALGRADGTDGQAAGSFRLQDEDTEGHPYTIEASDTWPSTPPAVIPWSRKIEIGGQRWRLEGIPTARFIAGRRSTQPLTLGFFAFVLLESMGALLIIIVDRIHSDELRATLRRLEEFRDGMDQAAIVSVTDARGVILSCNDKFCDVSGYPREAVIGQDHRLVNSGQHPASFFADLWSTIKAGRLWRGEIRNRSRNGTLYWVDLTIVPLLDEEGRPERYLAIHYDITDRIKREEQDIEMAYAASVQKGLFPQAAPQAAAFDIAGAVSPAQVTGGDYFDYLPMPAGALGIAIGDVCGHGLPTALIMAETRAYLRPLAARLADPGEILDQANDWLYEDLQNDSRYVTLAIAALADSRTLVYANAGHLPGVLIDRTGAIKARLDATGLPLGMFANPASSGAVRVDLNPGDVLVMLTDGVTEAESPEGVVFGPDRALDVVRRAIADPAATIVRRVRDEVAAFTREPVPRDDLTVVICKVR